MCLYVLPVEFQWHFSKTFESLISAVLQNTSGSSYCQLNLTVVQNQRSGGAHFKANKFASVTNDQHLKDFINQRKVMQIIKD